MYKYVIKRILFLIPTIIGVTLIIYFVMNLTPGDPGRAILGTGVPQADIDAYNEAIRVQSAVFSEVHQLSDEYVFPWGFWYFLCDKTACFQ